MEKEKIKFFTPISKFITALVAIFTLLNGANNFFNNNFKHPTIGYWLECTECTLMSIKDINKTVPFNTIYSTRIGNMDSYIFKDKGKIFIKNISSEKIYFRNYKTDKEKNVININIPDKNNKIDIEKLVLEPNQTLPIVIDKEEEWKKIKEDPEHLHFFSTDGNKIRSIYNKKSTNRNLYIYYVSIFLVICIIASYFYRKNKSENTH